MLHRSRIKPIPHDYSKEELIAELCSAFLCAEFEIMERTFENSAAYLNGWINKLEKNPKCIIMTSSKAEKAYQFIIESEVDIKIQDKNV